MEHARDSFLKYLSARLAAEHVPLDVDPVASITLNSVSLFFLTSAPIVRMNPGIQEMIVSLDVMAEGTATETAPHKVLSMASAVDRALSGDWIKKQDWTDPDNPIDLKTYVSWRPWGNWRRVPEPNERFAHLNRTVSLIFIGEKV
jgi:hypothetical protein